MTQLTVKELNFLAQTVGNLDTKVKQSPILLGLVYKLQEMAKEAQLPKSEPEPDKPDTGEKGTVENPAPLEEKKA